MLTSYKRHWEKRRGGGITHKAWERFENCPACAYHTAHIAHEIDLLLFVHCVICDRRNARLEVPCPTCATAITIEELAKGECTKCGFKTSLDLLLEQYGPREDPKEEPRDGVLFVLREH